MDAFLNRLRWWGNRPLVTLAAAGGILSLLSLAANEIDVAATVAVVALGFALASFAVWTYRRLPDCERTRTFSRQFVRNAALISVVSASLLCLTYWYAGWKLDLHLPAVLFRHYRDLDLIPSAFSLLLPVSFRSGFHQFFRNSTYCFPGPFWWESMRYLRTAIPSYSLVFFSLACAARIAIANLRFVVC